MEKLSPAFFRLDTPLPRLTLSENIREEFVHINRFTNHTNRNTAHAQYIYI